MHLINKYKKIFNVDKNLNLKELKTAYRNLVKEWHPDKFQDGDEKQEEAEEMSRQIIDGYHFLVSISPETHEKNTEAYQLITTEAGISDYHYKKLILEITFTNGGIYEYYGVDKKIYTKMVNSSKPYRFAKRNIFNGNYIFRKVNKTEM